MQGESNKQWKMVTSSAKSLIFSVCAMLGLFSDNQLLKIVGLLGVLSFLASGVSLCRDLVKYFTYGHGNDLTYSERVQILFTVIVAFVPAVLLLVLDYSNYSEWIALGGSWSIFPLLIIGASALAGYIGGSAIDRSRVSAWSLVFSSFVLGVLISCFLFKNGVDYQIKKIAAQIVDARSYSPGDLGMYIEQKKALEAGRVPTSLIFILGTASAYLFAGLAMRRR